jgi:hypothetical protein
LINSYSKTNAIAAVGSEIFGVFKDGSCGSYRELDIKMDCEDNNQASMKKGYTGSTVVDNLGDIHYQFCLVNDRKNFPNISAGNYAVLSLDRRQSTNGTDISFDRYFDNEDHDNRKRCSRGREATNFTLRFFSGCSISAKTLLYHFY